MRTSPAEPDARAIRTSAGSPVHVVVVEDHQAVAEGMTPLRLNGLLNVRDGVTSLYDVVRETM